MKRLGDNQNHENRLLTAISGWWRQADVGTDLSRIVLVVLLALGLGLIYNAVFIWPNQTAPPPSQSPQNVGELTIEHAYQLAPRQQAVIVDTREPADYADEHIAGAVNLPVTQFDSCYPDFASQVDKNRTVILYCAAGCSSKETIARELRERGYKYVNLIAAEPEDWATAGYPVATGEDTHRVAGEGQ